MTVKELIEELNKLPDDLKDNEVYVRQYGGTTANEDGYIDEIIVRIYGKRGVKEVPVSQAEVEGFKEIVII